MPGIIGQLFILIAFVATGLAGFAFFRDAQYPTDPIDWKRIGRAAWGVMTACIVAAWGLLIVLIATHQFQYNYVYEHSSLDLPMYYLFSSAWQGQEGSFGGFHHGGTEFTPCVGERKGARGGRRWPRRAGVICCRRTSRRADRHGPGRFERGKK